MISNYDEIIVLNKSLVCIDLDETIIHFPGINQSWWENRKKAYDLIDDLTSDQMAYKDWLNIIHTNTPKMLDEIQFNKLMERVKITGSKIVIITARNNRLEELTIKHLLDCNINISDVFYSNKKGDMVNQIKRLHNGPIIFIDDIIRNINDVKNINPEVTTYHMKHINL
jgi:hypothetical protein